MGARWHSLDRATAGGIESAPMSPVPEVPIGYDRERRRLRRYGAGRASYRRRMPRTDIAARWVDAASLANLAAHMSLTTS